MPVHEQFHKYVGHDSDRFQTIKTAIAWDWDLPASTSDEELYANAKVRVGVRQVHTKV